MISIEIDEGGQIGQFPVLLRPGDVMYNTKTVAVLCIWKFLRVDLKSAHQKKKTKTFVTMWSDGC